MKIIVWFIPSKGSADREKGGDGISGGKKELWGAWVVQSVKCLTLNFGLGHDLRVHDIEPRIRLCVDSAGPA